MVQPIRSWTIAINQEPTDQTSQLTQYRDLIFAWKTNMVMAGWTVVRSSDGDAGASAPGGGNVSDSDNWTSASVLGVDSTGGGGAWIILQAPSAFLSAGGTLFMRAFVNEPNTTNPRIFSYNLSTATYTGGTTTSLPTTAGTETSVDTTNQNVLAISSGSAEPVRYSTWRSTRGDTYFMVKREGIKAMEFAFICYSNEDTNGAGQGEHRFFALQAAGSLFNSFLVTAARTFNAAGTTAVNGGIDFGNLLSNVTSDDLDYQNNILSTPVHAVVDSSAVRYLGLMIDTYAGPPAGTIANSWGRLFDDETTQAQRRVSLGFLFFFAPSSALPFI